MAKLGTERRRFRIHQTSDWIVELKMEAKYLEELTSIKLGQKII